MSGVAGDLAKKETGEPVQNQEKIIVRDLDELIAALEKECQNCKGNIGAEQSEEAGADSMIHGGTGGIGDLVDPGKSEKDWAKLSARERDRILQSMSEGFPPEYRTCWNATIAGWPKRKRAPAGAGMRSPARRLRRRIAVKAA